MFKLTKQRQFIYDILKDSNKPLSIENIFYLLPEDTMNLSTVYRTIEYFQTFDILLKFNFNDTSYYILNLDKKHHHYSICTSCLEMKKIECHLQETIKALSNDNFSVTEHEMTVYGLCSLCRD